MKTVFTLIFLVFVYLTSVSQSKTGKDKIVEIDINPDITFQTIESFGASDAWSCQFVGNWSDEQKNRVADLLFSMGENEDGSPRGIGLTCWRFNIGAGSAEQTGETKISDRWRQTECFLRRDASYDWNAQAGQRWFLRAAKERGVESFIAFVNSPPVWLTKNGRANSDGGNSMNILPEDLPKFSDFLVETIKNIQEKDGILFNYISPVNEPQWDWKGGQEGSPWKNTEIAQLCHILGNDLNEAGLRTKITITEAGQLTQLFDRGNDAARGFQIKEFFSENSENYIGDIPNVAQIIAGHSYFTTGNDRILREVRSKLKKEINRFDKDLDYWMSEYCILGNNDGIKGSGRDLGIETALFVANVIHADLVEGNAASWQWWLAVSPYDFKDGLIYIDKSETGGDIYESKLLWALGNYSRFIRPGAKRISAEPDDKSGLKISAFQNTNKSIIVVIINREDQFKNLAVKLPGNISQTAEIYETSESKSLSKHESASLASPLKISPKSITTLIIF